MDTRTITMLPEAGRAEMLARAYEADAYVTPSDADEFALEAVEESEAYWYTVVDVRGPDEPQAA